ncbi:GNAT family N-acetyltransferase [Rhodococcus sp. T2V]|nr:GNAT family N-acetyltransferase [Rhodococcus sp. T2V]
MLVETAGPVIRPAGISDAPAIAAVHVAAWRAAYTTLMDPAYLAGFTHHASTRRWREILAAGHPDSRVLVVVEDGALTGFSAVGRPHDAVPTGVGQLYAINVHPDRWGTGLGAQLLTQSQRALTQLGYRAAYLWVASGNIRAIDFYLQHGWTSDGITKWDNEFHPPIPEDRMSITLTEHDSRPRR